MKQLIIQYILLISCILIAQNTLAQSVYLAHGDNAINLGTDLNFTDRGTLLNASVGYSINGTSDFHLQFSTTKDKKRVEGRVNTLSVNVGHLLLKQSPEIPINWQVGVKAGLVNIASPLFILDPQNYYGSTYAIHTGLSRLIKSFDHAGLLPFVEIAYRKTNLRNETEDSFGLSIYEFSSSEFIGRFGFGIALNSGQNKFVIEPYAIFGDDGFGGGISLISFLVKH